MQVVAEAGSSRGEVHLCRRDDGALELRVNGVFVMDTKETTAERLLARAALEALPTAGGTVLVGGLGLGFTLAELLDAPRVRRVIVAEIEPDLVSWHRCGVIPALASPAAGGLLADPRVRVEVGDVRGVVAETPRGSVDAILLDVDNGPGFLVYNDNADLYRAEFLAVCAAALSPAGVLAVWSAEASDELLAAMRTVFAGVAACPVPVRLGRRTTAYHVYLGQRRRERGLP